MEKYNKQQVLEQKISFAPMLLWQYKKLCKHFGVIPNEKVNKSHYLRFYDKCTIHNIHIGVSKIKYIGSKEITFEQFDFEEKISPYVFAGLDLANKEDYFNIAEIRKQQLNENYTYQFNPIFNEDIHDDMVMAFAAAMQALNKEEFVLPDKWHVVVTEQNHSVLSKWLDWNEQIPNGYVVGICRVYNGEYRKGFSNRKNSLSFDYGIEITFEQFKKYVLKEEIMEKKIIEYRVKPEFKRHSEQLYDLFKVDAEGGWARFNYGSILTNQYKEAGVLDLWFEPIYEEDKTKIFTLTCAKGTFELEVSKKGIYYRPENSWLNKIDLEKVVSVKSHTLHTGNPREYECYSYISHVDLGCKKMVPAEQIKEVISYYDSLED